MASPPWNVANVGEITLALCFAVRDALPLERTIDLVFGLPKQSQEVHTEIHRD